jgi:hypothetical protein
MTASLLYRIDRKTDAAPLPADVQPHLFGQWQLFDRNPSTMLGL